MRIIEEIRELAKNHKVYCFFDMDGTCAELKTGEKKRILDNEKGYFLGKRPLKTVLSVMEKISKLDNVEVCILTNCYYNEQKQDKIAWLKKYAPFIKDENINVIVLTEEKYTQETKHNLKPNKIKSILKEGEIAFLFEDNYNIINATNKLFDYQCAQHMSMLIE